MFNFAVDETFWDLVVNAPTGHQREPHDNCRHHLAAYHGCHVSLSQTHGCAEC